MESWKILLVDDDAEDRTIIRDAMEALQAKDIIHFAENGEEALAILDKYVGATGQTPCLVVLDLNMPRMNGTETLRQMKGKEQFNKIPVIIYSTSINALEKEKCMMLGAHEYITKPISFKESKETAQKLLEFCKPIIANK